MDALIAHLNSLRTYPSIPDLLHLAQQLKSFTDTQINTQLLPALTNQLLVADIKRLMTGVLPSLPPETAAQQ
ncbi:hypothetical protein AB4Y36_03560 [Paraburkholderia sp. BR10936]|uniref:hypothetical protein n=1 Tax=Paraburkholderia sp. BR10936 TaxID=3236993 RepID=UPI0034D2B410